ncbi:transglycosylase SLT domain-containing protein [Streptomyces sp. GZWMJZ-114]|uniref:transglycosylase SLT domain-containing protein n=1 Tax=Streptomyces sp. GZWMJZ-114 TaxID=2494734 RepID=UPI0019D70268|nr:transglycosylase SLT domain-containing protein [Streptomyces sp. GZWMJZ-114]
MAYNAGWRGETLVTATAVALAESSGRYWVVNSIGCVGLWQINVPVHIKAHPSWTTAAMKDPAQNASAAMTLYKAAKGWKPWEAYTTGAHLAQVGRARLAAAQITGTTATAASSSTGGGGVDQAAYEAITGSALDDLGGFLGDLGNLAGVGGLTGLGELTGTEGLFAPLASLAKAGVSVSVLTIRAAAWIAEPRNWLRVVEVLGGGVALIIGLRMLAGTGVGGPVAGVVRAGSTAATKTVKGAKKAASAAAQAGAAVATGGASAAATGAAKAATAAKGAA